MEFDRYQRIAWQTDQFQNKKGPKNLMVPLLGLAGEAGTVLSEFKKKLRDKESYAGFRDRATEELGDVLWYVANIASRLNISLDTVASKNLIKIEERWSIKRAGDAGYKLLDEEFPISEQFPRKIQILVKEKRDGKVQMYVTPSRKPLGDSLSDNSYIEDGYRFHDVFHLGYMTVLGWSPVMRKLLNCKRKSRSDIDEVEDGARARIFEELIAVYVYNNAQERNFYSGVKHIDTELLTMIKRLVTNLEVGARTPREWERAILEGYRIFRFLLENKQVVLDLDLRKRKITILKE